MVRPAFLVTGALAVAALGFQVSTAHAKHSWSNYHWERDTHPVVFDLMDNELDSAWDDTERWGVDAFLQQASDEWSVSSILSTSISAGGTYTKCEADYTSTTANKQIEVCSHTYGLNGWLGLAKIWIIDGHIIKAVTKLNDSYFSPGSSYDTAEWRDLVMCQEVGHAFGLGHQDESFFNPDKTDANGDESCMDYTNRPAGNGQPNLHDYEQLETIYNSHLDGSDSAGDGGTKPGNGKGGGPKKDRGSGPGKLVSVSGFEFATYVRNDPSEWGTAVAFTDKGQPRVFVKDLENGVKVVTHVTWTEDARAGAHFPHQH